MHPVTHRIHQAVAALIQKPAVGPTDVSQFLGLANSQTAKSWETRGPSNEGLVAAAVRGISVRWLRYGEGPMLSTDKPAAIDLTSNPNYPSVRCVQFRLSAGVSGFGIDYLDEEADMLIVFKEDWFKRNGYKPGKLFAAKVANSGMEPGLYDGDLVIVNTAQTNPKDGIVFAVNYEGELVIKRLIRDAGQWWLYSDNPNQREYPPKHCHESVFLIGQVVYKQSTHI